jgi:hypothetical protein
VKIVVAQDALHSEGGVESYLAAIIPALRARGHSIALLYVRRGSSMPLVGNIDGPTVGVDSARLDAAFSQLRAWDPDVCFWNKIAPREVESQAQAEWPVV